MKKTLFVALLVLILLATVVGSSQAITNGQPEV